MIDLRFVDIPGTTQHFTVPIKYLNDSMFSEGLGFDGSSIIGFQQINNSDMVVVPDIKTAFLDPFTSEKTLVMHCNVKDPVSGELYSKDPRNIAKNAEKYLLNSEGLLWDRSMGKNNWFLSSV